MGKKNSNTEKTEVKQSSRERQLSGLIPFKKGQSGNPKGRPVGSISIMGRIKKIFEEDPERFEEYVNGVLKDKMMRKEIVQQIDGKPVQPISGVDGSPIMVTVVKYVDDIPPIQTETISTPTP